MATSQSRTGSDTAAPSVAFSYAQAAKGLSAAPTSAAPSSKPSPDTSAPSKDASFVPSTLPASMSWADDVEASDLPTEQTASTAEDRNDEATPAPKEGGASEQPALESTVSSPDLGASSSSTITKDDDVSSLPNTSSESTWENKSQASTSVDKSVEPAEKTSEKVKGKALERSTFKPLQEAPPPAVNIWKLRAEESKAKAIQRPPPTKSALVGSSPATANGVANGSSGPGAKKSRGIVGADKGDSREKMIAVESKAKGREEEKTPHAKKEAKPEKGVKGKPFERDAKSGATMVPPPPARDQESWPTPETAIDEDRKKSQSKGEKIEKERKESVAAGAHGKQEWVKVPYTPTVVFNTPLPGAASARRGGRGGGRGGAQTSGRPTTYGAGGAGQSEKDSSAPSVLPNGDQHKRGRLDGPTARDASPLKSKRAGSTGSPTLKERSPALNGDKSSKTSSVPETEAASRRASNMAESASGAQVPAQPNAFPRQYPSSRPNKGRKGEVPNQGERRKDGDIHSPTKENAGSHDRQASIATQTDATEDGERRVSTFHEGHSGHSKQMSNGGRPYGSFSGRDRPRGGSRGGRSGYQNGHQYANGHAPMQSSSSFPLRSPTTFHPDQNAFFPPPPTHGRGYRGNGQRSQSVTTDSIYGRAPGYPGGPQPPHIQSYMGPMYDYPMIQPMTAVPYSPYGVDQMTLLGMVTTQIDYYFSVENLCKDIFLRKHMDSKGFVFLTLISDFSRIKQLTTDMELIKLVCFQSKDIEFRVGQDGKERLRRREGWEQWVLSVSERHLSAQNDGPEELHKPPFPHPHGFDQSGAPRFPDMSAVSPTGPGLVANEAPYPIVNGANGDYSNGIPVPPMASVDDDANGLVAEGSNGSVVPNGHPSETSTETVSCEPDSFSDEQVENLTVIVRKQDQSQTRPLPPTASRTFSNGTIDSRSSSQDKSEQIAGQQSSLKANGIGASQSIDSNVQDQPRTTLSPFAPVTATTPVRLFWVKDNDAPVDQIPSDSTHESYYLLRSKALYLRQNAPLGVCPYDMDILYQFWSHFLIRNFNSQMYDEFCYFAFNDVSHRLSDVGIGNLIKFYGESLLSPQGLIRKRIARDYVQLVKVEDEYQHPAFKQLQSAFRNGALDASNRKRIGDLLDPALKASLE